MSAFITVSTTVTITVVTAVITVTAITAAAIISSLLLSQLLLGGRGYLRSFRDILSFSYFVWLYFCLAILLQYRMLGDNVLGGGGMWWCRLDHA